MSEYIDVVIDTETTGLCNRSQVISIGYCFRNPETKNIISSNVMIKPDIERMLSQNDYHEALRINNMTLEQIKEHPISYHDAIKFVKNEIINKMNIHLNLTTYQINQSKIRFLAYNKDFDYRMLARMPDSKWIIDKMPSRLFAEEVCDHYANHHQNNTWCSCESETACIMLRASERWARWSEYHQSYSWLKLVDAFYFAYRQINERNDTRGQTIMIEVNGNRMTAESLTEMAHDSGADAVMALIVHETLQEASK